MGESGEPGEQGESGEPGEPGEPREPGEPYSMLKIQFNSGLSFQTLNSEYSLWKSIIMLFFTWDSDKTK